MTKYPYANIESLLPYDFKYKVDNTTEFIIPKNASIAAGTTAEPSVTYTTNSIGAWKTEAATTTDKYIAVFERASRKATSGLPAEADPTTKLYLVSAEVAAVGRKIEGRKDLITPADLIRARYNDNRYIRFLNGSAVPAT